MRYINGKKAKREKSLLIFIKGGKEKIEQFNKINHYFYNSLW